MDWDNKLVKLRSLKLVLVVGHLFISFISRGQTDICDGIPVGGRSLHAPGGSLHGVIQQDQDGLGTCYANVASLIAKSYNSKLPAPSYLHLAGFNLKDPDKRYDFDLGEVCYVLEEVKKSSGKLCAGNILENQPSNIQGETLYRLYDVINKYGHSPYDMDQIVQKYESMLKISPVPPKINCEDEGGLDLSSYIQFQFENLASPMSYSIGDDWDQEEERCAKLVEGQMIKLWGDAGLSVEKSFNLNKQYLERLKKNKLSNGQSQYEFILGLINSFPTKSGVFQLVMNDESVRSYQYQKFIERIVRENDRALLDEVREELVNGDQEIKACLDRGNKNWVEPNPGLFFNTISKNCHKTSDVWLNQIRESTRSCSEEEGELIIVFRTLSSLGASIDDIKKYIVKEDQNILKQIVEKNCKEYHDYSLPPGNCQLEIIPPGMSDLISPEKWDYYSKLNKDLEDFLNIKKLNKENIDLNLFIEYWANKYNVDPAPLGVSETEVYRKMIFDMLTTLTQKMPNKVHFSFKQIMDETRSTINMYQNLQKNGVKKVVESIRNGKAIGLGTCSAMLTDSEKGSYPGCIDHSVTVTGVRCVNGKLNVEITNSWGIGCKDNEKSKAMYSCQRDENGLTNGRSWVDVNYLSRQGFSLYSF